MPALLAALLLLEHLRIQLNLINYPVTNSWPILAKDYINRQSYYLEIGVLFSIESGVFICSERK